MIRFQRFPCPVCGYLRPDNESSCPECDWRKPQAVVRKWHWQFDLAWMFDFMILVGFAALFLKFFVWIASHAGFLGALAIIAIIGALVYPWVALYRWWANDNF